MTPQIHTNVTVSGPPSISSDAPNPQAPHAGQQPSMRIPPARVLPVELQTIDQLQQSAVDGDLDALATLGSIYLHGSPIVRPGILKDDAKAIKWWSKAANQGHARSQNNLGVSHAAGRGGLDRNDRRAVEWFTKAANQGDVAGQYNLGVACARGVGIEVNQARALALLTRSAMQGYALAQHWLGIGYATGCGVPQNDTVAFRYHLMAAQQGDVASQGIVGFMLETGVRIPRNLGKAVEWYEKASTAGNANATCRLARLYANGLGVIKDEDKSAKLYHEAALQGDPEALYQCAVLSFMSANGKNHDTASRESNLARAFDGWTRAAAEGHPDAMYELGNLHGSGICTDLNLKEAFVRYVDAAERGNLRAHYKVSTMYATGSGVERDDAKAAEWWDKAAVRDDPDVRFARFSECLATTTAGDESNTFARLAQAAGNGLSEAQFFIGMAYQLGIGFTADAAKAVEYFDKAARQGHPSAQYRLGKMHVHGSAPAFDIGEAFRLLNAAAQQGHREAQFHLARLCVDSNGQHAKDEARGMAWLHKAASQGSLNAQARLGHYLNKVGIERDEAAAFRHIETLAMNNAEYQYELGNRYASGRGIARDDAKAELWWRRAAVRGHTLAQGCLRWQAT